MRAAAARFQESLVGLSPESIALILTAGFVLGTFPIYGCPTLLCLLAALTLRLNLPALLLVNHLTTPLQIALVWPLASLGARILPGAAAAPAAWKLAAAVLEAMAGWLVLCVPLGIVLYVSLLCALRLRNAAQA